MKLQMRQQNLHQLRFSWKWGRACQGTCSSTQANACWYPAPCNWSIASEYWYWYEIDVNDVASHCSVVDHAQSPGVVADVLRVGMERSAFKMSTAGFEPSTVKFLKLATPTSWSTWTGIQNPDFYQLSCSSPICWLRIFVSPKSLLGVY